MKDRPRIINAVFEGGGVKGIGMVGAFMEAEAQGFVCHHTAGTSSGAIVAALVAAGYSAAELREMLLSLPYPSFQDKGIIDRVPWIGPAASLVFEKGIFEGAFFERWMRERLAAKGVRTFGDLLLPEQADHPVHRWKLQVIASDITSGRMLIFPRDAALFGIDPDALEVARAVRMSMSIPYFFEPVVLRDAQGLPHYIVDGGVLSNYPVWLFDDRRNGTGVPTVGFKMVEPDEGTPRVIRGPITLFAALFSTMMEAHDARYIEDANFARTVPIPTLGVQTTDFDISRERQTALFDAGVHAARRFFATWDAEAYHARFDPFAPVHRRRELWGEQ